jgi:hypothetical protein
MQRQMFKQLFSCGSAGVMRHSRDTNFLLFNVFYFCIPRALSPRLSLDLSCCIALCVLNATQTVFIEEWT